MSLKLLYAIILTLMPVSELRGGLPVAISYALEKDIPIFLVFILIVLLNILLVFFVFYFLDYLHKYFMNFGIYKRSFEKYLKRFQKRVDKFEKRYESIGFLALLLFVSVPLPGTGAWSGCLVSWLLDLERKKSILAISTGVLIAGVLILSASLGFIGLFNML